MPSTSLTVIVSGFLGAGKSRIVATLARASETLAGPDRARIIEADALCDPVTGAHGLSPGAEVVVVTAADAVNLEACLDDATCAPLITTQLRAADCVALTRTDAVDSSGARAALATLVDAPVIDAAEAPITLEAVLAGRRPRAAAGDPVDMRNAFCSWNYRGPAILEPTPAAELLRDRPAGVYRLSGLARTGSAGIDLQVFGRGRQTQTVAQPDETWITAIGPRAVFRPRAMDWAFSQAVAASAYLTGMISCR